ncbi:MAG: hypothetical protein IJ503_02880 [Akkermansia sp.]|nr:hypothetical protein [Akkermansia sp.]
MKTAIYRMLILLLLLSCSFVTAQTLTEYKLEQRELTKAGKSKKRNVGKAAQQKRKALREQGVRNVRAKSPSGWPTKVPVPDDTELKEAPKKGQFFIYETNNYEFHTPVALDENARTTIGRLFECAYEANKAVGEVLPVPRTEEDRSNKKYLVQLWPTVAEYRQNGGPADSAGVFTFALRRQPGKPTPVTADSVVQDKVMVPFPSLGLNATGHVVSNDIETHTLVHELTHQNFLYNNLPIWCNEGWAEYIGCVPYVGEDLEFTRCFAFILKRAQDREQQGALNFPFSLQQFLTMSQEEMYSYMPRGKDTYTLATMIITFYVHLDGKKGVEALRKYMQALLDGETPEEAAQHLIEPHKNARQLQKDFVKAWKRKKVNISFAEED